MKKTKLPKGHHEVEVEYVKDLLDRGMGITEIIELTSLDQEDILKINEELQGRL